MSPRRDDNPTQASQVKPLGPPTLREATEVLIANAEVGPDPRMGGSTDCYLVTLDDYAALVTALAAYQRHGR